MKYMKQHHTKNCKYHPCLLHVGPAVEYNGKTSLVEPIPPPVLGQHTEEVLRDILEYSDSEIDSLEQDGAVETCRN